MQNFPLMMFAAGFGTRMGALSASRPKPMIQVAKRPLIDYALDIAAEANVARIVVNLHYLGGQIEAHLKGGDVLFSWERDQILETGGGLRAALPLLKSDVVFSLNTDAIWKGENPLNVLRRFWNPDIMDNLLLLGATEKCIGVMGKGDFNLKPDGQITRVGAVQAPFYLGAQITKTAQVITRSERVFSLNRIWDDSISRGRAFGVLYPGLWCDVGRPESISLAEKMLQDA